MGIFDIFTGKPAMQAAEDTRNYLGNVQNTGTTAINTARDGAMNSVAGGAANARSAYDTAYGAGSNAVNSGADAALGYAGSGANTANGYYDMGKDAYGSLAGLASKYGGATTMALNGLGVNGQGGTDAARAAFTAGPAYNWNLDQGLEAINRRRAASGTGVASGNADRDAQKFGAGLASNEYKDWMTNLLGFTNPELGAAGSYANGVAALNQNQGNMNNSNALTQAQFANSRGGMLADLSNRYGTNVGGSYANEGQSLANLQTGAAGQQVNLSTGLAGPVAGTYKAEGDAAMAGSGNLWNLGLNALTGATSAAGKAGGFSKLFA